MNPVVTAPGAACTGSGCGAHHPGFAGPSENEMGFDWKDLFDPVMSPFELFVRGALIYWFLFLVFRFVLRRDTASAGISDILFVVLVADASQNGMIGEGTTVSDSLAVIATLVFWNYLLDYLAYHSRAVSWLVDPPALLLVRNGRKIRRNMRREHLTDEEIDSRLRAEGVDDIAKVRRMLLEPGGTFSVIKRKKG
jgi:uncharacterized membrane protein YcaP (DUF421 family)